MSSTRPASADRYTIMTSRTSKTARSTKQYGKPRRISESGLSKLAPAITSTSQPIIQAGEVPTMQKGEFSIGSGALQNLETALVSPKTEAFFQQTAWGDESHESEHGSQGLTQELARQDSSEQASDLTESFSRLTLEPPTDKERMTALSELLKHKRLKDPASTGLERPPKSGLFAKIELAYQLLERIHQSEPWREINRNSIDQLIDRATEFTEDCDGEVILTGQSLTPHLIPY